MISKICRMPKKFFTLKATAALNEGKKYIYLNNFLLQQLSLLILSFVLNVSTTPNIRYDTGRMQIITGLLSCEKEYTA